MEKCIPSGRPTVGEVDLGALEFNYQQIKKRVREAGAANLQRLK
jgi:hypothetical protein